MVLTKTTTSPGHAQHARVVNYADDISWNPRTTASLIDSLLKLGAYVVGLRPKGLISYVLANALAINTFGEHVLRGNFISAASFSHCRNKAQ